MMRSLTAISAMALLTACGDGQPFYDVDEEGEVPDVQIELDGTDNPNANRSIIRIEPGDGDGNANEKGGGLVRGATYNEDDDVYVFDNLAFDGENQYEPDEVFTTLGGYGVYAADETVPDLLTGGPVDQIVPYRAITGRSGILTEDGDPRTTFAIVRTGGYSSYGFGGFVYARNGDVTLPTSGQAQWEGEYAGIRVFDPLAIFEYTVGDVAIAIDFDDFNSNDGVKGTVSNRRAFTPEGAQVDLFVGNQLLLPDLPFVIQQGIDTLLPTGELSGELRNTRVNNNGELEIYEDGKYYAIIAGDATAGDGGELVGVFVVDSEDPRVNDLFVQETGGFILDRAQP
ncbi:hypothetical protein SAMN04488515_1740 [Cognatiyoonia koreensis]|uniref:Transferrin-binding protein B C-lobe/N-lobe beta barrel domain-containing protein n=1 Tax=Cognatiyoonia koreensis TaxID=364200 RepID=A0A1I0Q846_9RHOB|nr:hypothetical protein [Cognatiyoonia koreensis]SEW23165.1 hypothetical protein SAMN04488515_1740 [Cognatiyoonia koreensis]